MSKKQLSYKKLQKLQKKQKQAQKQLAKISRVFQSDTLATLRTLVMARPYEPGDLDTEHIQCRAAFERLKDGGATQDDFDLVAHVLNAALVRAEQIDESIVQIVKAGQDAMVRMKDRFLRGMRFGFDAEGLRTVPEALDAWEAMADVSSPLQLKYAIQESFRRASGGQVLTLEDASRG